MRAFQLVGWQQPPELREVPVPEPGPGQVLVKVGVPVRATQICTSCRHPGHHPDSPRNCPSRSATRMRDGWRGWGRVSPGSRAETL